jgi:hypothetical protein
MEGGEGTASASLAERLDRRHRSNDHEDGDPVSQLPPQRRQHPHRDEQPLERLRQRFDQRGDQALLLTARERVRPMDHQPARGLRTGQTTVADAKRIKYVIDRRTMGSGQRRSLGNKSCL